MRRSLLLWLPYLRMLLFMKLSQNRYTFGLIAFVRIILLKLRMRPRRWRSWRHHRLALSVGYFTLSYSRLERRVYQAGLYACDKAISRLQLQKQRRERSH